MSIEIRRVTSGRERNAFIRLPWRLHGNEEHWVPPLLLDVKRRLDPAKNPFFSHAEVQLLLALRDGEPVGRISAHIDRHLNEFQDNRWGLFGFICCEDDPEVAGALLEAAASWLAQRGCNRMVGPMDFTTNDECGVLVDGFDRTPTILNPWTAPYYPGLLAGAGLSKAMDLLMYDLWVDTREAVHPAIWEMAAKVESEHGVRVRKFNKKDLYNEISRFLEVYNAAWERNWGFVPLTEEEVRVYAKDLKPILDENWAFIAEKDGETVGAALTLPDYNQVLKHLNGRLLPFGWAKALYYRGKIDRVRVFALGVKREYRHTGIAAKFYEEHFNSAERTRQKGGEMGWILETNEEMNRAMAGMGGRVTSTYRVFERELSGPALAGAGRGGG